MPYNLDTAAPGLQPFGFVLDTIHRTAADRLLYRPHLLREGSGVYLRQAGTRLEAGKYADAVPHIGEGLFLCAWTNEYGTPEQATRAIPSACWAIINGGFDMLHELTLGFSGMTQAHAEALDMDDALCRLGSEASPVRGNGRRPA